MCNITKIKALAKENGVSLAHLCALISRNRSYFHNANGNSVALSDAEVAALASALRTSVAYLRDETDNPNAEAYATQKEQEIAEIAAAISELPDEKIAELKRLIFAFVGK